MTQQGHSVLTPTVLGSACSESQKRVSESAEALAIRQAGETSILASIAGVVSQG
jgi:hypothetical protein